MGASGGTKNNLDETHSNNVSVADAPHACMNDDLRPWAWHGAILWIGLGLHCIQSSHRGLTSRETKDCTRPQLLLLQCCLILCPWLRTHSDQFTATGSWYLCG